MAKDPNPNNIKRNEVDEVFMAQVTEKLRHNPTYMQLEQAQKDLKIKLAQEVVDKAIAKRMKKLAKEVDDKLKNAKKQR